ncbi:MAG: hypothetical protein IPJ43_21185 [Saprospiraceae bacterium]|nr:hypothetical protein [Saprospiraceae bacterium]
MLHQWVGALLGAYFASIGLFAFGCAAGNCLVQIKIPNCNKSENIDAHDINLKK